MLKQFFLQWRKAAQNAVAAIINASSFSKQQSSCNPPADRAAEFCEQTLDGCLGCGMGVVAVSTVQAGQSTILHTLGLMKDIICRFSKNHIKVGNIIS